MDLGLRGKVALVTGGSRGIGRATSLRLAAEGCAVSICGRTADSLEKTLAELRVQGVPAHAVIADVSAPGEVERFVDESVRVLGAVDLLVANVGGSSVRNKSFLDMGIEDWEKTFHINLFHAVRAVRATAPHMVRRGGGSVVIIASISGWKLSSGPHYAATKAGEIMLANSLAWELGPQRIRVNAVSPGATAFPGGLWERFSKKDPESYNDYARRQFAWGRLGTDEEIADVAVFLLSDRARWVNGTNIHVDGAEGGPCLPDGFLTSGA